MPLSKILCPKFSVQNSVTGYADADLVKVFEQRTGSKVLVTYIDLDEALWQRVNQNGGKDFAVFAVNTAELQRYIPAQLVQPIQPPNIPNISAQLPRFQNVKTIAGLVHQGQVFAVPCTYAEMGLIFDRHQVTSTPDSIAAL